MCGCYGQGLSFAALRLFSESQASPVPVGYHVFNTGLWFAGMAAMYSRVFFLTIRQHLIALALICAPNNMVNLFQAKVNVWQIT